MLREAPSKAQQQSCGMVSQSLTHPLGLEEAGPRSGAPPGLQGCGEPVNALGMDESRIPGNRHSIFILV